MAVVMTRVMAALIVAILVAGCASSGQQRGGGDRERASQINTELGMTYLQQGNNSQAMESLKKALDQDRNNYSAHATIAVLYERLDQHDQAREHFRRAVRLNGEDSSVRNNYGRFLCNRGEYDAAQDQFARALRDPLYERRELPLANAGLCALQAGEPEKAEDFLRRALEYSPTFPPALRRMAELRHDSGDNISARGYMQRYRDVANLGASDLWLAVRIENALGNRDDAASYGLRLRADFPDSEETRMYNQMRRDGRS
ncbi:type IV pilus assembly protein PilF [Natronocella acetinitrilica]|uniref:Type IV pilus assembly protein PilF n=1 Tax=Natronocella acetinitrilica TaxID=414046 RepID=A0AAE3KC16_9GAMM|nr:type IV pilus biogenesis/stability protein PilW [Natronocella acetinitrilica]MCP1676355.1 type IV pilus assembly protein PilF [Natronocella acetinitrilica]